MKGTWLHTHTSQEEGQKFSISRKFLLPNTHRRSRRTSYSNKQVIMATIDQIIGSPLNWDDFLQRTKKHNEKHLEEQLKPRKDDSSCKNCFSSEPYFRSEAR